MQAPQLEGCRSEDLRSRQACEEIELALLSPLGDCAPYLGSLSELARRSREP